MYALDLKLTSVEAADNAFIAFKNWNGVKNLKLIKNKTLVIWGDHDKSYTINQAKILKKYIKIASVENLFSANQKRFVIQGFDSTVKGFIDLYDYNAEKRNAFVGIVILKKL